MKIKNILLTTINALITLNTFIHEIETYKTFILLENINEIKNSHKNMYKDHYKKYLKDNVVIIIAQNSKYNHLFRVNYEQTIVYLKENELIFDNYDLKKCENKIVFLTDDSQITIANEIKNFNKNKSYRKDHNRRDNDEKKDDEKKDDEKKDDEKNDDEKKDDEKKDDEKNDDEKKDDIKNDDEKNDDEKNDDEKKDDIKDGDPIKLIFDKDIFTNVYFPEKFHFIHEIEEIIYNHFKSKYDILKLTGNKYLEKIYLRCVENSFNKIFVNLGISIELLKFSCNLKIDFNEIDNIPIYNSYFWEESSDFYNFYLKLKIKFYSLLLKKEYFSAIQEFIDQAFELFIAEGIMKKKIDLDKYPEIVQIIFNFPLVSKKFGYIPVMGGVDFRRLKSFFLFEEYFDIQKVQFLINEGGAFYFYFPYFNKS
ncbi:Penicillin-binding protein 1A/1B [Dictyocoela muelleri]|nr:Penicillin-binding protein 1A/1B [Dictyocoela muelleri]